MKTKKKHFLPLVALALMVAPAFTKAQTYAQFASSPTSEIQADVSGQIGIGGLAQPASAKLHVDNTGNIDPVVRASYSTSVGTRPAYYFLAERITPTLVTDFSIDQLGHVGIGTASPSSFLTTKSNAWQGSQQELMMDVVDAGGTKIVQVVNIGTSGDPGAALAITGKANRTALGVYTAGGVTRFNVRGDGKVGINMNSPQATFDVIYDGSSANVMNVDQGRFTIASDGRVNIMPPVATTGAALTVRRHINIMNGPLLEAGLSFVSATSQPRHTITENIAGDMIIDPGISGGGGNNRLKVDGELETTNNVTVNGTITVKDGSGNQFKVYSDGKVRAREVKVDLLSIPDYVFDKNYTLPTIEELGGYISKNKHLPNIPSECEYEERGEINIGELNMKLLEKVEELSLYVIQLNERIKMLEN